MNIFSNNIIAIGDAGEAYSFAKLQAQVCQLSSRLQKSYVDVQQVLVTCDCTYHFLVAVLAALKAYKTVVILPNTLEETLKQYSSHYDLIMDGKFIVNELMLQKYEAGNATLEIPDDANILFFTSGSSGLPSKIEKKFISLWSEVNDTATLSGMHECDLVASTVPHHHMYGFLFKILAPLSSQKPFYIPTIRFPNEMEVLNNFLLVSSPAFLGRLDETDSINGCKKIISSGGPLSFDAGIRVTRIFKATGIEVYGSTETGGIAYRHFTDGKIFKPLPGVKVRSNNNGQLEIDSNYMDYQGWYTCSDFVAFINNEHFEIIGRSDDVIKIEEKRISLVEIQNLLFAQFDYVGRAYVFPYETNSRKKLAALIVKSDPMRNLDDQTYIKEMTSFLKKSIDPIFVPKKWKLVNYFETNELGKAPRARIVEEVFGDA